MSDIENLDVMLGRYSRNTHEEQEEASEIEIKLLSRGHQQSTNIAGDNFWSLLKTNESENSEITAGTSRGD